jgi:adenylyltransferase/sulfurtransferase
LKEIVGAGDSLSGRLIIYDAKAARFETVNVAWDPDNPLSGRAPTILSLSVHAPAPGVTCGTAASSSPA